MNKTLVHLLLFVLSISLGACTRGKADLPKSQAPHTGILFVSDRDGNREIYSMRADGGDLTRITNNSAVDSDPDWSPDGTQIVFRSRRDGSSDIFVMAASGGDAVNLISDPSDSYDDEFSPKWNPDGSLLAIFTDRFQPPMGNCLEGRLGVHHLGFIPLEGPEKFGSETIVQHFDDLAGEQETLGWSSDGSVLAFSSICSQKHSRIYLWDRETREVTQLTSGDYDVSTPVFSPDGRYLAYTASLDGALDILIQDLQTGEIRNLTQHPGMDRQPTWSPDSSSLAFTTDRDGNNEIYIIDLNGENARNLTQHPGSDIMPDWSPVEP